MALKRLESEFKQLSKLNDPSLGATPYDNDLFHWSAFIMGPPDTLYAGGKFRLDINFTRDYPFQPPHVVFVTKILHPNVNSEGNICMDILRENWSSAITIEMLLRQLGCLLISPNANDPLNSELARLFTHEPDNYKHKVRAHTIKYAMSNR